MIYLKYFDGNRLELVTDNGRYSLFVGEDRDTIVVTESSTETALQADIYDQLNLKTVVVRIVRKANENGQFSDFYADVNRDQGNETGSSV